MLRWAVIFLIIAIVAALFGFTGIAAGAAAIAKFLFGLFLLLCLIFFILITVIDLPAGMVLGFWFVLQFFTSPSSGVAWMAHVGGFLFGVLVTLPLRNRLRPQPVRPAWFG